jgi:hypothetical protein
MKLPDQYVRYLEGGGVLEAFTEGDPGYVALWPVSEIEQNNLELRVAEYAPGFLGFGGNGGGELLAFDKDGIVYIAAHDRNGVPLCSQDHRILVRVRAPYKSVSKLVTATRIPKS